MSAQTPIKASTQEHLNIEDIKDDIIILKDGSCCLILQTNAVNFNLLSETEQEAIIFAYAGLLNSLSFPIQIFIRSRQKDISSYLVLLKQQQVKQKSPKIQEQIKKYQLFIEKMVKDNRVLDKDFYLIIPFSAFEYGASSNLKKSFSSKNRGLPFPKEYILEKAKTYLAPKKDHIIKQFSRLGLKAVQLKTKEIIQLFYGIYNSEGSGQILGDNQDYNIFLVNSSLKNKPDNINDKTKTL